MTLHPRDLIRVPEETKQVAHAAFPKGHVYITMRDQLNLWYKDSDYAFLFESSQGRPAESPGRLNLILIIQFVENLSDRQMAEAVGDRITIKYALGLKLTDCSFDASVLARHRARLLAGGAECQLLEDMLRQFRQQGLLKARGKQRTDSTAVLASIRELNRMECIGETMRHALNSLATVDPQWLREQVPVDWFDRYVHRFEQYRLPKSQQARHELAEQIGADGVHLLNAVYAATHGPWLREVPAVETLRQVWLQQFVFEQGQVKLRKVDDLPPAAQLISSPYDVQVRRSYKRETSWTGYKVHLTESCEDSLPMLITNVETTPATTPDSEVTAVIHEHLAEKGLLPAEHLVDAGYVDAGELVTGRSEYGIDLVGPVQQDTSWQAQAKQGYDLSYFAIHWENQRVTCPRGKTSILWCERKDQYGNEVIDVRFDAQDCHVCVQRAQCTRAKKYGRTLKLRSKVQHEALQEARQYQCTDDFKERYKKRAGVEGLVSQGVRCCGLRRSRYIGLAKTHLQHILTAAAINLTRAVSWVQGTPRATTRVSAFAALAPCS